MKIPSDTEFESLVRAEAPSLINWFARRVRPRSGAFVGPKLRELADVYATSSVDEDAEGEIDAELIRLLEEWLDAGRHRRCPRGRPASRLKALKWRSPSPAEAAAALRALARAAETP